MPPLASWFAGREAIAQWAAKEPMSGVYRWRVLLGARQWATRARLLLRGRRGGWVPFALNVLTFRGREIANVTAFIARSSEPLEGEAQQRLVHEPVEHSLAHRLFVRFGLPERLSA